MSDKELNLIGYINVDGSNSNITGSINENGSSNNLVGSTINTSLEFVVLKGASAYEVAKNNGYKGTVEEWLNDLRYDHSEEFLEFANGIQNQINALAERHERYEEKFDGLNEKIDSKVIPTKVSEFENDKGYITEHQDISNLATKEELSSLIEEYFAKHPIADNDTKYSFEFSDRNLIVSYWNGDSDGQYTVPMPTSSNEVTMDVLERKISDAVKTKANIIHEHSQYVTKEESDNRYAFKGETSTGKGLTEAQIDALHGLAICLRDAGCTEEYTAFYNAFYVDVPDDPVVPDTPTGNPVSISWSGTTAKFNNLKSTTITWSETTARIGA